MLYNITGTRDAEFVVPCIDALVPIICNRHINICYIIYKIIKFK